MRRALPVWLVIGWAGFLVVPWYGLDDGVSPPAMLAGHAWLWPLVAPLLLASWAALGRTRAGALAVAGAAGLAWLAIEALAVMQYGWGFAWLSALLGPGPAQPALGWGAVLYAAGCTLLLAHGLARQGLCKGDVFVVGALLTVVGSTALFVFSPVMCILLSALRDNNGGFAPALFGQKLFSQSIWDVGCITGDGTCGVAWHTVSLTVLVGLLTTLLGLAFALVANRTPLPLPVSLTGTGMIIVISFVFRNLPVGIRAGLANLSQIDRSLDEASLTLGACSPGTLMHVIMPLMRPAIVTAAVYSFVAAVTAVSAVIFVTTGAYNLATVYIVGRVDVGDLGVAIVYSAVLIVFMLLVLLAIQALIGERRLGRRTATRPAADVVLVSR
jgi:iron(III) transport system permease protein